MKGKIFRSIALLILLLTGVSCDKNSVYDHVINFPSAGWASDNAVEFDVPVNDTKRAYDMLIHLRNTGDYKYSNIWLFIETKSPNGNAIRDTFEIKLADDAGRWTGKGIGNVYELLVPYKQNILFPNRGIYQVRIWQAMRDETIDHLLNLGLRLQYHNL
jgi:gliding motility-associated lipoprotein GldH